MKLSSIPRISRCDGDSDDGEVVVVEENAEKFFSDDGCTDGEEGAAIETE